MKVLLNFDSYDILKICLKFNYKIFKIKFTFNQLYCIVSN